MNKDLKIEYYLLQLDQNMQALPLGQRAEIITEIKSHILESLEKDPQREIDSVLADLGAPRLVAERYLAAKGVALSSPRKSGRWLKWLAVGTVALFAFIFLSGLATIWYFSPLIKVDEKNGRVVLFGGLIDVNENLGHVKVGSIEVNEAIKDDGNVTSGEELAKNVKLFKIPFNTAKLDILGTDGLNVKWSCKSVGTAAPKAEMEAGILSLNLDGLNLAKCTISIPRGMSTEFRGVNGHMDVISPHDAMKISLVNGKVNIKLDPARVYDFDINVKNGLQDFFPRSASKEAVRVKVDVVNGLVKKE